MKNDAPYFLAAALLAGWLFTTPQTTHAARHYNLSINNDGSVEHCSDLRVKSDGEIAQAQEAFIIQKSEAAVLELNGADRGVIRVRGWDRPEYSVETCKFAAAENRAAAEQTLRGISVSRSAGRVSATSPSSSDDVNWQVYFIVRAPRDGSVDLETKNGPIEVAEVNGTVKVHATNGPVSVKGGGLVDVNTKNGPISFEGSGGEVHLTAQNGPISLRLQGEVWNGPRLEARTINGPLSINVPDSFRSGVRVETSGHAPISCSIGACQGAWSNDARNQRVLQLNGSQDTIRVYSENGPVSVGGGSRASRRII